MQFTTTSTLPPDRNIRQRTARISQFCLVLAITALALFPFSSQTSLAQSSPYSTATSTSNPTPTDNADGLGAFTSTTIGEWQGNNAEAEEFSLGLGGWASWGHDILNSRFQPFSGPLHQGNVGKP